jgi:hypothetical protein
MQFDEKWQSRKKTLAYWYAGGNICLICVHLSLIAAADAEPVDMQFKTYRPCSFGDFLFLTFLAVMTVIIPILATVFRSTLADRGPLFAPLVRHVSCTSIFLVIQSLLRVLLIAVGCAEDPKSELDTSRSLIIL